MRATEERVEELTRMRDAAWQQVYDLEGKVSRLSISERRATWFILQLAREELKDDPAAAAREYVLGQPDNFWPKQVKEVRRMQRGR